MHFGHCEAFALVEVDTEAKRITGTQVIASPPHQPGMLPGWLAEKGADMVIAGGMGQRAQQLFAQQGIEVVVGAAGGTPEKVVESYLAGSLETGANLCDH